MRKIKAQEFVRRLKALVETGEQRFCFFLGAGCSISSGIPATGTLVKRWLPRLKKLQTGSDDGVDAWAREQFPGYAEDHAAAFYGEVIEQLFFTPEERQKEIERLCDQRDPAFGYAVLAQLMGHNEHGRFCNVVLTTNFDDTVADALYLYTNKKPLVISHESLAGFVRVSRTRPLVVKLHGDSRLTPYNTAAETEKLAPAVKSALRSLLMESGLIFLGYSGADKSITALLRELSPDALPCGSYWVNSTEPSGDLSDWLVERNATWVQHLDFDELMLLIRNEFDLPHPDNSRFDKLNKTYYETLNKLTKAVSGQPESTEKRALENAVRKATEEAPKWWQVEHNAAQLKESDPDEADRVYLKGIGELPGCPELLSNYAVFLVDQRKDYDRADEYYRRALAAGPDRATILGNYALFLANYRDDYDQAEVYYRHALEVGPDRATSLSNYAVFLVDQRKDYDRADEYYRRALEAAPDNATILGNYALFLANHRKDYDRADDYYRRALKTEPDDATNLGNYALFLTNQRKEHDRADEYYRRALEAAPDNATILGNYALLLTYQWKDYDRAEGFYRRALEAGWNHANNLNNYAVFLTNQRKDIARAEEFYGRALAANPEHTHSQGNYAGFLLASGKIEAGWRHLQQALFLAKDDPTLELECNFYRYTHAVAMDEQAESLTNMRALLTAKVRSPGWDLSRNVARAVADGHPEPKFLAALADVIADKQPLETLEAFPAWTVYGGLAG